MLDRVRVTQELARLSLSWNSDVSQEASRASASRLATLLGGVNPDRALTDSVSVISLGFDIPFFQNTYNVLGVDGSQIYPDRSFAAGELAVLNVGGIFLKYGEQESSADFFSRPECVTREALSADFGSLPFCPELIDLLRCARELELGFEHAQECAKLGYKPSLVLFDGAMINHGLMLKNTQLQKYFTQRLSSAFRLFAEENLPVAWYTSAPQARTLSSIIGGENAGDATLLAGLLQQWTTTAIFSFFQKTSVGVIVDPEDQCSFLYLSTGDEIARLEMPRWVAQQADVVARVCAMVRDQVEKGMGYPVALTEAHRQAVVSEADRQAILQVLEHSSFYRVQTAKMLRKIIIPV